MPISYINRKNKPHYLIAKLTKKGNKRYYIVKNIEKYDKKDLLNEVPEGYEFYEYLYDARVVLRKKIKPIFTEKEKAITDAVMQKHETVENYIIELDKESLLIYLPYFKLDDPDLEWMDSQQFENIQSYLPKLRVIKKGKDYAIQRFCVLSRYYGWIVMETHEDLKYLCEKYCFHIDKKSLLNFWIDGEVFENQEYDDW